MDGKSIVLEFLSKTITNSSIAYRDGSVLCYTTQFLVEEVSTIRSNYLAIYINLSTAERILESPFIRCFHSIAISNLSSKGL